MAAEPPKGSPEWFRLDAERNERARRARLRRDARKSPTQRQEEQAAYERFGRELVAAVQKARERD